MRALPALLFATVAASMAGPVHAADGGERPFCADRPGKATPACTLDAGRVQVELDLLDNTVDRSGGTRTTDLLVASPTVKVGLTPASELQVTLTPWQRHTETAGPLRTRDDGLGDTVVRLKVNLSGNDANKPGVALLPFVKIPTAKEPIGNGRVEGGVAAPLVFPLPAGWSLTLDPEADLLANDSGPRTHLAAAGAASLGHALTPTLGASLELWGARDFVSQGAGQASFDLSLAWTPMTLKDVQFDAGTNIGLTRDTPDWQAYVGVSKRF